MAKGKNMVEEIQSENEKTTTGSNENGSGKKMKGGKMATAGKGGKKSGGKSGSKTAMPKASSSKNAGKQKGGSKQEMKGDRPKRFFKVVNKDTGESIGRYVGDTPKQAASKGFTKTIQRLKKEGKKVPSKTIIYIRESTRGSARKIYGYEAVRNKLDKPQVLPPTEKSGERKTITYKFRNVIKKVPVPEQVWEKLMKGGKKMSGSKTNKKNGKGASSEGSKKKMGNKNMKKPMKASSSK